ncbi:MAG TPA: STAS domain-containing protein [Solirubrobacteraceae bacterium]|jgi:anti-sigma B factor antagonist|nr:STAS domain-containing protein [Solirubrobacteraceae bacterium]
MPEGLGKPNDGTRTGFEQVRTSGFEIREQRIEGERWLLIEGELDMRTAGRLSAAVRSIASAKRIVLDLGRVSFIDSVGLRAILMSDKECRGRGCVLTLAKGPEQVHRVFEICGVADRFVFERA